QPDQRGLAAAVRAGDRDEFALLDPYVDAAKDLRALAIGKRDVLQLDGCGLAHLQPRAVRSAARFSRMTEKYSARLAISSSVSPSIGSRTAVRAPASRATVCASLGETRVSKNTVVAPPSFTWRTSPSIALALGSA